MRQLASFWVGGRLFGIDVKEVQEVTRPLPITQIRKSPSFILGLVNLRGQLSTAVGLNELFGIEDSDLGHERMAVVCHTEAGMLSLLVDQIGDVLELPDSAFSQVPAHVDSRLKDLIGGVYQLESGLLSVLEVNHIILNLNDKEKKGA